MGYLYLCIALFAGTTKGFCGKKLSGHIQSVRGSLMANILRMLLCTLIGGGILLFNQQLTAATPSADLLFIGGLSGVATAVFVVTWLLLVRQNAYMLLDVFLMLGIVVPLAGCQLFFQEAIGAKHLFGILLLLIATWLMCGYNNRTKQKLSPLSLCLLILCGLSNGVVDFLQKVFVKNLPSTPVSVLNLYTYLFAAAALLLSLIFWKREAVDAPPQQSLKAIPYIAIMAVCLFAHSYFKTTAAQHLDAVLLYPLSQGAALILSAIMAAVFFKERLNARCVIALAIAFLALLLINFL